MSRNRTNARWVGIGMAAGILLATAAPARAAVVRQPYLQLTTPTSVTIVWRTDTPTDSRVRYGTVQGSLTSTATVATSVTNHVVTITTLSPATKYYYDAGSTTVVDAGGTAEHYFVTAPTPGSSPPFRAWVVGDSGTGGSDQIAVRNAMLAYTGASRPDMMLHVGDIAYTSGTETEFTDFHFTMYQDIFRHTVQWPTLGNHEGASTTSGQPGTSTGPYYTAFVLPTAAEAGGTASGTEAYYSFNYGNTHFISLNSYQVSRSASGPMATWLQSDLSATTAQWIVAYWHHPPYSHGTHNSDVETELREMRTNILPILEAGGVDLVLAGHSHNYERSYLIDGTYSTPTPDFATLEATGHILDDGNGKPTGDGPYQKNSGITSHGGAVYVVAGHGGAATGGTLDHPVMYFSETLHGSCILDISGSTLTLTNVRASGVVSDTFQMQKGPQSPKVTSTNPPKSAVLATLTSIQVTFSTGVTGVDAADLTVNGTPATLVSGPAGGSVYTFTINPAPGNGHVGVVLVAGGIADAVNPGLQFTGNVWSYTIDTSPPRVATEIPTRGSDVGVLPSITVNFTKAVTGVEAANLLVNGQAATTMSGIAGSAGPYTFTGYAAPGTGLVTVTMLAGTIQDEQSQPFAGDSWVYVLRPHLVINEYLNSNNGVAQDEFGNFDDYIEVYNPSNVAVDMSGMHLSDTLDFPAQYEIPNGVTIPAHGHLVFWCDGQTSQGPLHTNFNLARAAEAAGLFDTAANGFAPVDSTSWVNGTTDQSVGRFPDGQPGFVNVLTTPGATNSISCTTAGQCSALTDACNVGACVGNQCVAQPANQGQSCDDGVACRGPDTCSAGVCDFGPSLCTGAQVCNLLTGLCETPLADPLPVNVGAAFRYFKGTTAPPATWDETSFDDSTWLPGASGFGYGTDCAAQHGTVLDDMLNTYISVYVRHLFRVDNPSAIASMLLTMDYDDGFVAYINGHEVARSNVVGTPPSNTQIATADHECSTCGATCNPTEAFPIDLVAAQLVPGNNVLAIQGHNLTTGSSDFTLIPTLTATEGEGCAVNPECEDNNDCTDDACVAGACQHIADDSNACSDGIACTNDACASGACVTTSACPGGQTCNLGNGQCESTPVTATFQQGVGGYTGAVDTFIQSGSATNNAAAVLLTVDGVPPVTDERQILIRFDNIFGNGAGQIPAGATISSATLTVNVSNAMLQLTSFNRMLQTWDPTAVWSAYGSTPWNATPGVQADGVEAAAGDDPGSPSSVPVGSQAIPLTASLQAWSNNPGSNFGWVLRAAAADSLAFDASEVTTAANRPRLSVTYTFSPPCSVDADCTDNNVCNGLETCLATVCQAGTPLVCNDGNLCTTDSCNPVSGCLASNNSNPCSDGDACTANDTCAGGVCVSGAAANCDDASVCTADSCNTLTGCVHGNISGSCSDSNLCTTGDVCSGGTCSGTAVTCGIGQTCNPGTGLCQSGPTTVTFQNGVNGYVGSADTYIDTALGSQATASPIVIDGSPVEQALLRFDGIFGSGAGQIPAGSTISSATLTLWVGSNTSDESSETVSFHRLLHAWSDTAVWSAYGVAPWNAQPGIQNDGTDAVAATAATATMSAVSTAYPVDVTTSLQAWAPTPATNFGWVILPPAAGTNGLRLESNESTTASNTRRPLLSVTFNPPAAGCTIDADCSDNNVCNGIETCVATVCQPGTALNCDDANVCTTNSCSPTLGCQSVNNTIACTDGNACTTNDACAGGVCVSGAAADCNDGVACTADSCNTGTGCQNVSNCGVGLTCNLTSGLCESGPTTVTFQQGASGYSGSADTYIDAALGTQASVSPIVIDGEPVEQALLRFDGIFGSGPGQIPAGSTISSATLTLWVGAGANDPSPTAVNFHRLLHAWSDADTWAAYAVAPWNAQGGIQIDGVDALATIAATSTMTTAATSYPVDVTTSLQAWSSSPSSNFGWAILSTGTDGLRLESNESTTSGNTRRPLLSVTFNPPLSSCTTSADCSDNNVCNGIETCVATVCQPGTALNCDDANVCTTNSCSPTLGCQSVNNTIACTDGNACTTSDTCAGGVCVPGPAANCNDGVACTADSCSTGTGCQNVSSCGVGLTCNLTSGLCESAPNSASFQQGISGYAGAVDTFVHAGAPTANNGAAVTLIVDGPTVAVPADERQILLRFDSLFVSQGGPIPDGATITLATLQLNITNESLDGAELHRMLASWSASSTWNSLTNGVQRDGAESVAAADVSSLWGGAVPTLHTIDVTPSVAAWSAGGVKQGWVFVTPGAGSDSWQFDSSEAATIANRPKLTVQYQTVSASNGQLRCALSSPTVAPGGSVRADVFLDNLGSLAGIRGYQTRISVALGSGAGTASVACPAGVRVDELRADYLFAGQSPTFPAVNCGQVSATSAILSGSVIAGPAPDYLSDATITVSSGATLGSTFTVTVLPAPASDLADAAGDPVAFTTGPACTITVAGCGTAADCNDNNVCTTDTCTAGVCGNAPNSVACSDGNACTSGDVCSAGVCAGTPLNCNDGDACTTDVCTAGVCSHPPTGACGVTGIVRYYRDSAGVSEPSIKPVPNVEIDGTQDLVADDVTDAAGAYGLPNLFGNVTVATLPKFGSPRVSDDNGAITSFDASLIGQAAVGDVTLSANQTVAGDVSGNGQVTSFDAARVAQFAVALIDHFDVGVATGSDWKLFRCDTYTSAASQNCGSPQFVFAPLGGPQTANFYAVLYGDVTGNWNPAALASSRVPGSLDKGEAAIARGDAERAATLRASGVVSSAPRPSRDGAAILTLSGWAGPLSPGERRTLVLEVRNGDGIEAIDLALRFDPRNATLVDVKPMGLATGWSVAHRQGDGGAKVALYGVTPLSGSGALLSITIEARLPISAAPVSFEASANEGTIPVRVGRAGPRAEPGLAEGNE